MNKIPVLQLDLIDKIVSKSYLVRTQYQTELLQAAKSMDIDEVEKALLAIRDVDMLMSNLNMNINGLNKTIETTFTSFEKYFVGEIK